MSFTILGQKDGARPGRPLILVTIVAVDGDTCYFSTASQLGQPYLTWNGNNYQTRVLDQTIDAVQAMSALGLDIPPSCTIKLADADASIRTNHSNAHGWRGAAVSLTYIAWDMAANTFSTDSFVWSFLGGGMSWKAGVLSLKCGSRANFQRVKVPAVPISRLCPWVFPKTAAQRLAGATDPTSIYWNCGYSPDVSSVATASFAGAGLNDLTSGGTYTGAGWATYVVIVSAVGAPDHFQWLKNGTGLSSPIAITGSAQSLSDGVTITFAATTGHTVGASWSITGTKPVGNTTTANLTNPDGSALTDASGIYVTCDLTRSCKDRTTAPTQGCMARQGNYSGNPVAAGSYTVPDGDITRDHSGRATGRFGGITWMPSQQKVEGRQYTTGTWVTLFNQNNSAIFGGYWHQVYGIQMVPAKVVNTSVAPNITLGEAVICFAPDGPVNVDEVVGVVINGVTVPQNNAADPNFSWYWINQGGRNGAVSPAPTYNGAGDCYGSLACIGFTLPYELAGPGQTPDVKVLTEAAPIATFPLVNGVPVLTYQIACCNPVWQLLDLIQYGNYTMADADLVSFINAAAICDANINYTDQNGSSRTHSRFRSMLLLSGDQRATLAAVLTGLRNNCGLLLSPNNASGLLQVFIEGTLADQQPAPVTGSNYNTGVSSLHADGSGGTGYYAYHFTEADIELDSLGVSTLDTPDVPNKVGIQFQDEANQWQTDSLSMIDPDGYTDAGNQEIDSQTSVLGICNFDQGQRRGNTILSKDNRGNDRDDADGTEYIDFVTTMKGIHLTLRPGLICALSYQQLGW